LLEERLYNDASAARAADTANAELLRLDMVVRPEWTDYNNHLSDFQYGHLFGCAMDALYRRVGIDAAYRAAGGMFYTVESHLKHLAEAKAGDALYVTTQVLDVDDKRLHVFHRLHRRGDDTCSPRPNRCICTWTWRPPRRRPPMPRSAAGSRCCVRLTPRFPLLATRVGPWAAGEALTPMRRSSIMRSAARKSRWWRARWWPLAASSKPPSRASLARGLHHRNGRSLLRIETGHHPRRLAPDIDAHRGASHP